MVTTRAERLLASGQWLLSAAPIRRQAVAEWQEKRQAWLRPGALFAAAVVRADVVHAATGLDSPEACAARLAEVLEGGPLFYDARGFGGEGSYTALLPVHAARLHPMPGMVMHPQRALLLVPAPDVTGRVDDGPWWVVPLDGPGLLCPPDRLGALAGAGQDAIGCGGGRGA